MVADQALESPEARKAIAAWDGLVISKEHYDVYLEPADGLIVVPSKGFWSVAEVDDYAGVLQKLYQFSRGRFGWCRVLVDMCRTSVQTAEVAQRFADHKQLFSGRGDKIALVMESSLLKMQVNRFMPADQYATFGDLKEARAWLTA